MAVATENTIFGEDDAVLETFRSVDFEYEKNGDRVYLSQERFTAQTEEYGDVIGSEGGVDIRYFSYNNRIAAPDYEPTEEERAAESAGELVFSYGDAAEGTSVVQSVHWTVNGLQCSLMQIDGRLSPEELAAMAVELIRLA